jgi:hypothetical protein
MKLNRHFTLLTIASGAANEPAGVFGSKEPGLGGSRTKTSAKVVLPAKSTNSTDHKDSTGLSSPKGALLGLASYDSDDDDDDDNDAEADGKDKIPISNLSSNANAGAVNTEGKSCNQILTLYYFTEFLT